MKKVHMRNHPGILKFFTVHSMIMFLTMVLLIIMLIFNFSQILLDNAQAQIRKNGELIQMTVDQLASHLITYYGTLRYNEPFQKVMNAESYAQLTPLETRDFIAVTSYSVGFPTRAQVSVKTPLTFYSNVFLSSETEEIDARIGSTCNPAWLGILNPVSLSVNGPQVVFGGRYYSERHQLGMVYISLSPKDLVEKLPMAHQKGQFFALQDQFGEIMFLEDYPFSEEESQQMMDLIRKASSADYGEFIHSGNCMIQRMPLHGIGCKLYSIADKSIITEQIQWMYLFTIGILAICSFILLVMILLFRRMIIIPLSQFEKHISGLRGKPDVLSNTDEFQMVGACKEIQYIAKDHAALLQSIRSLNDEIQKKAENLHRLELLSKNIQIEQLRSQINPHFLYNTLELIRADAIEGKIDQVSSITAAMGKIYRYSIKGEPFVPLREELAVVRAYLTIQQNRFQSKIRILNKVEQGAEEVMIPKMILQPLVENAIVHGLEPSGGTGMIFIGADIHDGNLRISVRDNGIGIPADQLEQLQRQLAEQDHYSEHIGIRNVNARLRLQYGAKCSFSISSTPEDGTCIRVQIPVS